MTVPSPEPFASVVRAVTPDGAAIPVEPDSFTLSELPFEHRDRELLEIRVARRSAGLWAVLKRGRWCLAADGNWDLEHVPSERKASWLAAHRFPLDEALERAQAAVPGLTCNGMTARQILAQEKGASP